MLETFRWEEIEINLWVQGAVQLARASGLALFSEELPERIVQLEVQIIRIRALVGPEQSFVWRHFCFQV